MTELGGCASFRLKRGRDRSRSREVICFGFREKLRLRCETTANGGGDELKRLLPWWFKIER